jgi:hypothetical protein
VRFFFAAWFAALAVLAGWLAAYEAQKPDVTPLGVAAIGLFGVLVTVGLLGFAYWLAHYE